MVRKRPKRPSGCRIIKFIKPMRKITNFYFESRYPVGYEVEYTKPELKEAVKQTKNLISIIKKKVK